MLIIDRNRGLGCGVENHQEFGSGATDGGGWASRRLPAPAPGPGGTRDQGPDACSRLGVNIARRSSARSAFGATASNDGMLFRTKPFNSSVSGRIVIFMSKKIWANSGDSHFLEPADLWHQIMPKAQADRMPRTTVINDDEELVEVDGKSFTRKLPKIMTGKGRHGGDHRRDVPPAARLAGCEVAVEGPRRGGHLGGGDVPVDRLVVLADRGSSADTGRFPGRERVAGVGGTGFGARSAGSGCAHADAQCG